MRKRTCSVEGCVNEAKSLGFCPLHYGRFKTHGDPTATVRPLRRWPANLIMRLRFMPDGCVEFSGPLFHDSGYGQLAAGPSKRAHVAMWILMNGPVPKGSEIHHRCHNRACVRPDHLEALNRADHRAAHLKTHCKNGHEFTPENTLHTSAQRVCRTCNRENSRRYKERVKNR